MSSFSIFIPYVFETISVNEISFIFKSKSIGEVENVELVQRYNNKNGESYNIAYIHFNHLYNNETAHNFRQSIENLKEYDAYHFHYRGKWYWKVMLFKKKNMSIEEQNPSIQTPTIMSPHLSLNPQAPVFMPSNLLMPSYPTFQPQPNYHMGYGNIMPTQGPMWYQIQSQPNQMVPPQVKYGKNLNCKRPSYCRHKTTLLERVIHPELHNNEDEKNKG